MRDVRAPYLVVLHGWTAERGEETERARVEGSRVREEEGSGRERRRGRRRRRRRQFEIENAE